MIRPLVLFASLVMSSIGSAVLAQESAPFLDVLPSDPYAESIAKLKEDGIIQGFPDETFRGREVVTRSELAVVVARMMKFFELSLPEGVTLRELSAEEKSSIGITSTLEAMDALEARGVEVNSKLLVDQNRAADVQDVTSLMTSAMKSLIIKINPSEFEEGDSDSHEGRQH